MDINGLGLKRFQMSLPMLLEWLCSTICKSTATLVLKLYNANPTHVGNHPTIPQFSCTFLPIPSLIPSAPKLEQHTHETYLSPPPYDAKCCSP